jgi:hypothetical protein
LIATNATPRRGSPLPAPPETGSYYSGRQRRLPSMAVPFSHRSNGVKRLQCQRPKGRFVLAHVPAKWACPDSEGTGHAPEPWRPRFFRRIARIGAGLL